MAEPDCQLEKVVRFMKAEEGGKYSLSDSKMFELVANISSFKQQQRERERPVQLLKPSQPVQPDGVPRMCRRWCGTKHLLLSEDCTFPVYNHICELCQRKGHFQVKCSDKSKGDKKEKLTRSTQTPTKSLIKRVRS